MSASPTAACGPSSASTPPCRSPRRRASVALAFRALGRIDEVIAHCRRAVALKPDYADAHLILGNALREQGKLEEAATHSRRLAHLRPNSADAHCSVATVYAEQGKTKEALASYQRSLALDPQHAQVLNGLGALLVSFDRAGEAVGYFQRAVQHAPDLPDSYINLASALLAEGRIYDACGVINRAFEIGAAQNALEPSLDIVRRLLGAEESRDTRTLFVQCLRTLSSVPDLPYLRRLLVRALEEPWGRPSDLAPAAVNLLKQNHLIAAALERCSSAWPRRLSLAEMFGEAGLAVIADDPLLEALLCATFIRDLAFERFLTNLRAALLQTAGAAEELDERSLRLCCALARQCFINEYVFDCLPEEVARAGALRDALAAKLESSTGIAPLQLAAVAAYFPLHSLAGAEAFLQRPSPAPLRAVLTQQIAEPSEERELASSIPALTAIDDGVSRAVQQQYEQNPYPRWVKAAPIGRAMSPDEYLASKFRSAGFQPLGKDAVDILIAGCGTGQHSVLLAQQFPRAQVLAIDLSHSIPSACM
jgi:Tfp pilus assembly protein PilF